MVWQLLRVSATVNACTVHGLAVVGGWAMSFNSRLIYGDTCCSLTLLLAIFGVASFISSASLAHGHDGSPERGRQLDS